MRNSDLAVSILSMVTTPERADSIVGDLFQEDGAGSPWRFWSTVVRTTVSQLWRQIATARFGMARTAILGMCVEFAYWLVAAIYTFMVLLGGEGVLHVCFHRDLPDWTFRWPLYLVSNLLVPFALGRWMFRRYPGREAVGTLTLAAFHAAINLFAGWICWLIGQAGGEAHAGITILLPLVDWNGYLVHTLGCVAFYLALYPVIMLAGALSARAASVEARTL